MPRLNLLDKSLGFHGDGSDDDWYDGAGIIVECTLPKRESMRTTALKEDNWFGRRGYELVGTSNAWRFRDRILEHNLGKSHDLSFSYYCKKSRHVQDYLNIWFQAFHHRCKRFDEYMVDSEGNIQKSSWRLSREKSRFKRSSKLYIFNSADLVTGYRRKSDGKIFTNSEYAYSFYINKADNQEFEKVVTQGYQVPNVQPNSKQEKRLRNEWNQKKKQLDKIRKENQKQKEYSFLTKTEIEIRESKKEENWKIQSHGFREDCFKGEGYHGRKNKKSKFIIKEVKDEVK